jgi:uncharacterized repeat protein (TIGR01451 family)
MNPQQEVTVTLASPTTAASCGTVDSIGYLSLSNGAWVRYLMKSPIITCTADLAITQVADHETVSSGDPIGFMIEVTNNGNGTASAVTLTDTLPAGTGLAWSVGGTDADACTITAGVLTCNFGDISPGAAKTIRLTSPTLNASSNCSNSTISNTATVMASNQPEGRSAIASITVLCPRAYASIWADTPSVTVGDPVNYTVTIGNIGDGIARDAFVDTTLANNSGLSWSITNVTPPQRRQQLHDRRQWTIRGALVQLRPDRPAAGGHHHGHFADHRCQLRYAFVRRLCQLQQWWREQIQAGVHYGQLLSQ